MGEGWEEAAALFEDRGRAAVGNGHGLGRDLARRLIHLAP